MAQYFKQLKCQVVTSCDSRFFCWDRNRGLASVRFIDRGKACFVNVIYTLGIWSGGLIRLRHITPSPFPASPRWEEEQTSSPSGGGSGRGSAWYVGVVLSKKQITEVGITESGYKMNKGVPVLGNSFMFWRAKLMNMITGRSRFFTCNFEFWIILFKRAS